MLCMKDLTCLRDSTIIINFLKNPLLLDELTLEGIFFICEKRKEIKKNYIIFVNFVIKKALIDYRETI